MSEKLVIRFDGPPSHESGRFIEVELDGTSISYGEWEQEGDDWLLIFPDADAKFARLEIELQYYKALSKFQFEGMTSSEQVLISRETLEEYEKAKAAFEALG